MSPFLDDDFCRLQANKNVLRHAIKTVLKDHDGELPEKEVCKLLGITTSDIPWGYNIGWARCIQLNQEMNLILSGSGENEKQT